MTPPLAANPQASPVLVTGATDGLGLATARHLIERGHSVLVHGRSPEKVQTVV